MHVELQIHTKYINKKKSVREACKRHNCFLIQISISMNFHTKILKMAHYVRMKKNTIMKKKIFLFFGQSFHKLY